MTGIYRIGINIRIERQAITKESKQKVQGVSSALIPTIDTAGGVGVRL